MGRPLLCTEVIVAHEPPHVAARSSGAAAVTVIVVGEGSRDDRVSSLMFMRG
jgi:hypothetical protein